MKKYLIVTLLACIYGCSKQHHFANHKYKLVSAAELVSILGNTTRVAEDLRTDRTAIWSFTDSELQIITYDSQNSVVASSKLNYSENGSFLSFEDEKYEVRNNKDTIELYKGSDLIYQVLPQD